MQVKKILAIVCFCVMMLTIYPAMALTDLTITRTVQSEQFVYTYIDAFDENNSSSIQISSLSQVVAAIDGEEMPVSDLKTVDSFGAGIHYVIVMDNSRKATESWPQARNSVQALIGGLNSTDRVSLIVASRDGVETIFTNETPTNGNLAQKVEGLRTSNSSGTTKLYDALKLGINIATQTENNLLMKRVIILYSHVNIDDVSTNLTVDELDKRLIENQVPLYVVSCGNDGSKLNELAQAARASGGMFSSTTNYTEIDDLMQIMQRRIKGSYVVQIDTSGSSATHQGYLPVSIAVNNVKAERLATISITAVVSPSPSPTVTPSPSPEPTAFVINTETIARVETESEASGYDILLFILLFVVALLVIVFIVVIIRKPEKRQKNIYTENQLYVRTNPLLTIRKGNEIEDIAKTICSKRIETSDDDAFKKTLSAKSIQDNGIAISFDVKVRKSPNAQFVEAGTYSMFISSDDDRAFLIGRLPTCDLQINEGHVSREHAELMYALNELLIRNVSHSNETFVNGTVISQPCQLSSGDIIMLDRFVEITVRFES